LHSLQRLGQHGRPTSAKMLEGGIENQELMLSRARRRLAAARMRSGKSWEELFEFADTSRESLLSLSEFERLVREILRLPLLTMSDYEVKVLFNDLDRNGSGSVDAVEFVDYIQHGRIRPQDHAAKAKQRIDRVSRNLRMAFQAIGGNEMDMRKIFINCDLDGSACLSRFEFSRFVRGDLGLTRWDVAQGALDEFFSYLDRNGNNAVELNELLDCIRSQRKDRKMLGAQSMYAPPDAPKIERKRKTHRQKLADELVLQRSTSLPSLCSSSFTNVGRARVPSFR